LSYLLIFRHIKTSNNVTDYKDTLTGNDLEKFNSYKIEIYNLLEYHSGSFRKKNYDTYYEVIYKFESSLDAARFYNELESETASDAIKEYRQQKIETSNNVITKIKVYFRNIVSNTSIKMKTIRPIRL
jgi:hypothetical protein